MTLAAIIDKIIPSLIIIVIIALFGMYMRIGYLEQTARLSIDRYTKEITEIKADIHELSDNVTENRENIIRLQSAKQ